MLCHRLLKNVFYPKKNETHRFGVRRRVFHAFLGASRVGFGVFLEHKTRNNNNNNTNSCQGRRNAPARRRNRYDVNRFEILGRVRGRRRVVAVVSYASSPMLVRRYRDRGIIPAGRRRTVRFRFSPLPDTRVGAARLLDGRGKSIQGRPPPLKTRLSVQCYRLRAWP